MVGRQWSDGLHQAVESKHAKEGVKIKEETQTLATVTLQNFFKLYKKLAGMTGTAATEADEFAEIYKLNVAEIPTNMPVQRTDEDDEVYRTASEKLKAIVRDKSKPVEERFAATLKLAELPRNASATRVRNRCEVTGRPRGFYRKHKLSRIALRELGSKGLVPGLVKSSW